MLTEIGRWFKSKHPLVIVGYFALVVAAIGFVAVVVDHFA